MTTLCDAVIGAEMMTAEGHAPRIDILSGIYYAQVKSLRAMHPLRMTLFIPRTTAKNPPSFISRAGASRRQTTRNLPRCVSRWRVRGSSLPLRNTA